jgi:GTPase SAR1 family protein
MTFNLRRPILIGGLGLTAGLWLLDGLGSALPDLGGTVVWSAIALGAGAWMLRRRSPVVESSPGALPLQSIHRGMVEHAIAEANPMIQQLQDELQWVNADAQSRLQGAIATLKSRQSHITSELDRTAVTVAIAGQGGVGKTSLLQHLQDQWQPQAIATRPVQLLEYSLFDWASPDTTTTLLEADLVVFLVTGDLMASDYALLERLLKQHQRLVLVMNKQDHYRPEDRVLVLQQIRQRVKKMLLPEDVVAIAADPLPMKVRQHQADGTVQETTETVAPQVVELSDRLNDLVLQKGTSLIYATLLRQARTFKQSIITELNTYRRDRAFPLIEQAQWIAGAAAFANPVPSLDLLATAAVNTQLVLDLSTIYRVNLSLEQAKNAAVTLGSLMVKLGIVELSSQAIAPLLKSNAVTYLAGGLVQGLSAAYLTRLAGLSLVDYFQTQTGKPVTDEAVNLQGLTDALRRAFDKTRQSAWLQSFVQQGMNRLQGTMTTVAP